MTDSEIFVVFRVGVNTQDLGFESLTSTMVEVVGVYSDRGAVKRAVDDADAEPGWGVNGIYLYEGVMNTRMRNCFSRLAPIVVKSLDVDGGGC